MFIIVSEYSLYIEGRRDSLKIGAVSSFETTVKIYQIIRCHIPEDSTLHVTISFSPVMLHLEYIKLMEI
jgi:hypothetical protein